MPKAQASAPSHNQLDKGAGMVGAVFRAHERPRQALPSSVFFDKRLWQADIAGSLAHAEMLAQGIIAQEDHAAIERGMAQITQEIESGQFEWKLDLEDVHLNIEARLTQLVGDAGKRLHTGRSRNDQVATDVRLWLRGEIDLIAGLLTDLQKALVEVASSNVEVILPGFTHLQVAQPVSFAHHLLAYVEMFARDALTACRTCAAAPTCCRWAAAALAGTTYPLDRERVARTLGMDGVCQNSLDAVSDRDFAIEFTAAASLCMVHVSRLSEELIIWMSQNFGFIKIADRFTTGSSIMPQKKNPTCRTGARQDRPRGRPPDGPDHPDEGPALAYNKDNQEDKEPLFDTVDTLKDTLRIFAEMVGGQVNPATGQKEGGITVNGLAMEDAAKKGYATATDLADYLVKRACRSAMRTKPWRMPSRQPSRMPATCPNCRWPCCRAFTRRSKRRVRVPEPARLTQRPQHAGGTAPIQVQAQIERHRARLV